MFGLGTVVFFVILAIFAPYIAPFDPTKISSMNVAGQFAAPGWWRFFNPSLPANQTYGLLGTDDLGRDLLSDVIYGAQVSMLVGFVAAALSLGAGLAIGVLAGYRGRMTDAALMRVTDIFLSFPSLPILIILAALYGSSLTNVILVIGLVLGWTNTARIVRSQTLTVKERGHVFMAKSFGAGDFYVIRRHIIPNIIALVFANATLTIRLSILLEASLSFVGLGDPTHVSWGTMLYNAIQSSAILIPDWSYIIVPGLCLALVVLGFTFLGKTIDEYLRETRLLTT